MPARHHEHQRVAQQGKTLIVSDSCTRPCQSSTSAMSASPACTSRIPRPESPCPMRRVSALWRRSVLAGEGAKATAAVGKAVTHTNRSLF
jgi:hypothetical protein